MSVETVLQTLRRWHRAVSRLLPDFGRDQAEDNFHRKCMKLAVEEARKSKAEDVRPHPSVGAVVVKDGQILATAHRGELSDGDHAEFTALEKKLSDATLIGATVYATLEPCTSRNHPKVPCARRLVERKIAHVYIGMLDPNPDIQGNGVWTLRDAGIHVQFFDPDLTQELEEVNRDFIRHQKSVAASRNDVDSSNVEQTDLEDKPLVRALTIAYDTYFQNWSTAREEGDIAQAQDMLIRTSRHLQGILDDVGNQTTDQLNHDLRNLEVDLGNLGSYPIGEMVQDDAAFWAKGHGLFRDFQQIIPFLRCR